MVDLGHGFESFLIRQRHQVEPVGFRQFASVRQARAQQKKR